MQFWIASFPRSGNTFFRNVLYYVYGLESSTYHKEDAYPVDEDYEQYFAVKTHLRPGELEPSDPNIPAVYLIRDGRESMVSIAHHKKDIVDPESNFTDNLEEAILAAEGSYFGGWSTNVEEWMERATVVIRFEDLTKDPKSQFERLEQIFDLPEADWSKLPSFEELKHGNPQYGGHSKMKNFHLSDTEFAKKFFRSGKVASWKEEMPPDLQDLFMALHGETMERAGYTKDPDNCLQNIDLDYQAMSKLKTPVSIEGACGEEKRILIEGNKLLDKGNDGVKRYLNQLLIGFWDVVQHGNIRWTFDLLVGGEIISLEEWMERVGVKKAHKSLAEMEEPDIAEEEDPLADLHGYERSLLQLKENVKSGLSETNYERLATIYRYSGTRKLLRGIRLTSARLKSLKPGGNPWLDQLNSYDLIHIPLPQNFEPFLPVKNKFIVTVHDQTHRLFAEHHTKDNINNCERGMKFIKKRKADIIGISKSTIEDTKRLYDYPATKYHLVYETPDRNLFQMNKRGDVNVHVRNKYGMGLKAYFLCLSTIEPRKNLPNTIRAFRRFKNEHPEIDVNLVIAGKIGWKSEHLTVELELNRDDIIFTGFVDDEDLFVIYSEAIALCYLSYYEGFGLPPLEAMACNTPVIYGDNSSLSEIIAGAGLPAHPDDLDQIAEHLYTIASDDEYRKELTALAYSRALHFTSRKMTHKTLEIYQKVIG